MKKEDYSSKEYAKVERVYIVRYDGLIGDISLNEYPDCEKDQKPDIFEIPDDEELVGFYGSLRDGYFQSIGLILYKAPFIN